jgi:hypothetical protein
MEQNDGRGRNIPPVEVLGASQTIRGGSANCAGQYTRFVSFSSSNTQGQKMVAAILSLFFHRFQRPGFTVDKPPGGGKKLQTRFCSTANLNVRARDQTRNVAL